MTSELYENTIAVYVYNRKQHLALQVPASLFLQGPHIQGPSPQAPSTRRDMSRRHVLQRLLEADGRCLAARGVDLAAAQEAHGVEDASAGDPEDGGGAEFIRHMVGRL